MPPKALTEAVVTAEGLEKYEGLLRACGPGPEHGCCRLPARFVLPGVDQCQPGFHAGLGFRSLSRLASDEGEPPCGQYWQPGTRRVRDESRFASLEGWAQATTSGTRQGTGDFEHAGVAAAIAAARRFQGAFAREPLVDQ